MPRGKPARTLLAEAFEQAIDSLTEAGAAYALIGGFAVAHHGLPRATRDIDLLLQVPRIFLPALLEKFREHGFEFHLEQILRELAEDHLSSVKYHGIRVDLLEAVVPLLSRTVARACTVDVRGRAVRLARAEELIALKMVAGREGDLRDVKGILATQGAQVDLDAVRDNLSECCEPKTLQLFESLVREAR